MVDADQIIIICDSLPPASSSYSKLWAGRSSLIKNPLWNILTLLPHWIFVHSKGTFTACCGNGNFKEPSSFAIMQCVLGIIEITTKPIQCNCNSIKFPFNLLLAVGSIALCRIHLSQYLSDPCAHGVRSLGRPVRHYVQHLFETLWRPSEDCQCCQCCEDLANED